MRRQKRSAVASRAITHRATERRCFHVTIDHCDGVEIAGGSSGNKIGTVKSNTISGNGNDGSNDNIVGDGSGYVNDLVDFEDDRVRATYGSEKYNRLARIKARDDPDNVFHLNHNIAP